LPRSPARWACIAGLHLSKHACRPAPHVVEHLPTSTPAGGPEQLQPLQVIGGELDPSEIVGDGLRAACGSRHGLGGAHGRVPLVATLSRRDDDPMPTTGRTSRWSGTGSWSVSSRKRARTTSASRAPWDAVRPIMIWQRGRVITQRGCSSKPTTNGRSATDATSPKAPWPSSPRRPRRWRQRSSCRHRLPTLTPHGRAHLHHAAGRHRWSEAPVRTTSQAHVLRASCCLGADPAKAPCVSLRRGDGTHESVSAALRQNA
jgi:hypothetical protein